MWVWLIVTSFNSNMGKVKELSNDSRKAIIRNVWKKISVCHIPQYLNIAHSTVGYIVKKWKTTKSTGNKLWRGQPGKISQTLSRALVCEVKKEPPTTCTKMAKVLRETRNLDDSPDTDGRVLMDDGLNGRVAQQKPLLTKRHKQNTCNLQENT